VRTDDEYTALALDRLMSYLEDAEIVPISELLNNKALQFGPVKSSPDLMDFMIGVVVDHVFTYTMSQPIAEFLGQWIVVDEAYFAVRNPIVKYIVRQARKFRTGLVITTQLIGDVDEDVIKNMAMMIILGGNEAYVNEMAEVLNLTDEDKRWLSTALPPHMMGLTTKALVKMGPITRQAVIELEPVIKGLG